MPETLRVRVPCRIEYMDGLVQLLTTLCQGVGEDATLRVLTAFNEAFTNVVLHSGLPEEAWVEVVGERQDEKVVIEIIDEGVDYQASFQRARDSETDTPDVLGGTGLFIIHKYMDDVQYKADPRNTLTMIRYLDKDHEVTR